MRIVRYEDGLGRDLEEPHRGVQAFAAAAGLGWRKEGEELKGLGGLSEAKNDCEEKKIICVTSGASYLGLAIVNQLLCRGYFVRITVDSQEDMERLKEMENSGEIRPNHKMVEGVVVRWTQVESLMAAFEECCGVFHTSAFADPAGVSGYTVSLSIPATFSSIFIAINVNFALSSNLR